MRLQDQMRRMRHLSIREQTDCLNQVLRGHYAYHGIAGNMRALQLYPVKTFDPCRALKCPGAARPEPEVMRLDTGECLANHMTQERCVMYRRFQKTVALLNLPPCESSQKDGSGEGEFDDYQ
jgi:hypothetical protein